MNARFWEWIHDGVVKITLKPGQQLRWGHGGPDDEGWSSECFQWELLDDVVLMEYDTDGRDCDGRMSTHQEFWCQRENLMDRVARHYGLDNDGRAIVTHENRVVMLPTWQKGGCSQRDYTAESMGY